MAKTLSFGIMHLGIAFSVTYALTGSLAISGAITFIEPAVNTVAHYFFDRYWERRQASRRNGGHDAPAARAEAPQAVRPAFAISH
ncbi:DUF2061 domain-containing protein [Cupriavidus respiraculi]|uniref:DUF2061 domain-containing protein n=1 Tax=Cupriavidus respiraculi TaxID=195930 RepID=A0ABM8X2L2_9BURK|nr:DUF2061 domain-containing protein [Cupriavidus respiraculi]CAG9174130.1 hypothetical protein LMG21510_02454 [Cupriavidus respiraculi]